MLKEEFVKNKLVKADNAEHKMRLMKKRARKCKEKEAEEEIKKHEGRFSVSKLDGFI